MKDNPIWLNLLLSGPNPNRWKMVREIVHHTLPKEEGLTVIVSAEEEAAAREFLDPGRFRVAEWSLLNGTIEFSEDLSPTRAHLLLYGRPEFADNLIEALVDGYRNSLFEMGRIATHVHSGWCSSDETARAWYEASIHFSDLVLLDNREEVEDPWVRNYQEKFRKQRYPCLFDLVRKGLPKHPDWLFESQPRRLSLVFDPDDLSGFANNDYDFDDEEEDPDDEEEPAGDPYLRRNVAGERERSVKPLPFALDETNQTKPD